MTALRCVSLIAVLFSVACAAKLPSTEATPAEGSPQAEIISLEKKIASKKSALSGGASAAQSAESPVPMSSGDIALGGRCDGVCQAAEEICTCHRRICRLASDINDEKSAESCRRAQKDCEDAGKSCASCR